MTKFYSGEYDENPIHLLKGLDGLVSDKYEASLLRNDGLLTEEGWSVDAKRRGLFVDLSQVRWVNIGTASQLVLLVESALKCGIKVYIALPLKGLTEKQKNSEKENQILFEALRRQRESANEFLKVIQFDVAVKCKHLEISNEPIITEKYEFSKDKKFSSGYFYDVFKNKQYIAIGDETDIEKYNYNYIFPLTWLDCSAGFHSKKFEEAFDKILSVHDRGLNAIDVASLKNVIITELLKNVKEHSGEKTNHALLAIGLFSTKSIIRIKKDHTVIFSNKIEYKYIDWLKKNSIEFLIEIYFGDSGNGVLRNDFIDAYNRNHNGRVDFNQKTDKYKILRWAFDKWSTRKAETIRGTKGLYRIGRIVSKYNGVFSIRTGNICGGFQKGGYDSQAWIDDSMISTYNHHGTFIQIKLCPYKEAVKFNFSFEKSIHRNRWSSYEYVFRSYDVSDFVLYLRGIIDSQINILLILRFSCDLEAEKLQLTVQESLKYISDFRHPNGVVVYISEDFGESSLQEIVNSANQVILKELEDKDFKGLDDQESLSPNYEKVYDPVLVLGKRSNVYWYGGNQQIVNILNEIYSGGNFAKSLNSVYAFNSLSKGEKEKILLHFNNDCSLVIINKEYIEFNFTNIVDLFDKRLAQIIESKSIKKNICTPRLKVVDDWIDIDAVLEKNEVGFALAMALVMIESELFDNRSISRNTKILIDNNQLFSIADSFASLNNIRNYNIFCVSEDVDSNIPRRTQLFEVDDDVIILTSFVSSSETIRRMVKYAIRDGAKPLCVLCLVNYREYNIDLLKTWNETTPILSIYKKFNKSAKTEKRVISHSFLREFTARLNSAKLYMSPNYEYEDSIQLNDKLPQELKRHFISTKSLHYSHVGKKNGRHFTFYINKERLLEKNSVLWSSVCKCISDWKQFNGVGDFALVQPETIRGSHLALNNCVDFLEKNFNSLKKIHWSVEKPSHIKEENLVYFDFGSLTGKSINAFLSSVKNANNILVCIVFSQFQNNELEIYNNVQRVRVANIGVGASRQISIPFNFENDDSNHAVEGIGENMKSANIEIKHLFDFPIKLYNSTTCPICEHERSLAQFRGDDNYNIKFAIDRVQKLQIRKRVDLDAVPTDFYNTDKVNQHELSSVLIMEMYELFGMLNCSMNSTQYRIKIYKYIFDVFQNKEKYFKDCDSQMYAMLYLISLEVNWLQKEPLVFREFRYMISEIATFVATQDLSYMVRVFSDNKLNATPINLAVRYKFSAITVLRSSNKYNFCKNISRIISSSVYDNRHSNNIVQNTLYHINSIHENSYNKSEEYFVDIKNQLEDILKTSLILSSEQRSAMANIVLNNEIVRQKLYWSSRFKKSPMQVIINLKNKIDSDYYRRSHPLPAKYFEYLDFRKLGVKGDAWLDFRLNRKDSEFYELFKEKQDHILDKWINALDFIKIIVYQYLKEIEATILKSELFYSSQYYWARMPIVIERFSQLINSINDDILNIITFYDEYHNLYDFMYDALIKYEKEEQPASSDSKLLYFLKNLPSKIYDEIYDIFNATKFGAVILPEDYGFMVFYPKAQLNENLLHIKNNIISKLNNDKKIEDVSLEINVQEEGKYIIVDIKNDCTDKFNKQNDKGGLNDFKDDLALYGGTLDYFIEGVDFVVKIKILKYEGV